MGNFNKCQSTYGSQFVLVYKAGHYKGKPGFLKTVCKGHIQELKNRDDE